MQSPEGFGSERPSGTPHPIQTTPQAQYGAPLPSPTGNYEMQRTTSRRTLKRIDPGSAFKIGAVTYALMWAVFGLPIVLVMGAASSAMGSRGGSAAMFGGGIMGYILGIALYGLLGGLGSVVAAFIYNLVAGWMGGVEFDLE